MRRATLSASPPSLQQNLGGIWEHTCSWLLLMSVECEGGQETKCPCCRQGYWKDFKGQKRPGLSVEHHCLYCNITEAWQVPLSAPSPNGNIQQLLYSSLSPRKSVQKLMVWDVSYSGVGGIISRAALLSLRVPSPKGAIQPGSK